MARECVVLAALLLGGFVSAQTTTSNPRPRSSDLGLKVGILLTGRLNAITDVAGVEVGHTTVISVDKIRTGVTAVLPHPGNIFRGKVPGAIFVGIHLQLVVSSNDNECEWPHDRGTANR